MPLTKNQITFRAQESLEALQTGLAHLQKKIRFYTLVSEAVKNKTTLPKWSDVL